VGDGPVAVNMRRARATRRAPTTARTHRCLDIGLATVVLLVALPLLLAIAIAIKLDSPGPVIFRQRRLGRFGSSFTMLKFRTMSAGARSELHRRYIRRLVEDAAITSHRGDLKKLTDDARTTRVGRVLRKVSVDELPQLINVLRAEMAIVGPRPALDYELRYYRPVHFERFRVRPGLTGLWQVSGRARLGFEEMLDLDVEYVRSRSVRRDLRILLKTPRAMVGNTA